MLEQAIHMLRGDDIAAGWVLIPTLLLSLQEKTGREENNLGQKWQQSCRKLRDV